MQQEQSDFSRPLSEDGKDTKKEGEDQQPAESLYIPNPVGIWLYVFNVEACLWYE